mgnify:CR=1 FL=1
MAQPGCKRQHPSNEVIRIKGVGYTILQADQRTARSHKEACVEPVSDPGIRIWLNVASQVSGLASRTAGAANVLEGALRAAGKQVWGENYTRNVKDLLLDGPRNAGVELCG